VISCNLFRPMSWLLSLLLVSLQPTLPASNDSTAVMQTGARFHEALAEGDSATVAALLLAEAVILEGGRRESRGEYLGHHYARDVAFLQAMTRTIIWQTVRVADALAYVATVSRLQGTYRDRAYDLSSAELLVLHRTPGGWRIGAVHWSSAPYR